MVPRAAATSDQSDRSTGSFSKGSSLVVFICLRPFEPIHRYRSRAYKHTDKRTERTSYKWSSHQSSEPCPSPCPGLALAGFPRTYFGTITNRLSNEERKMPGFQTIPQSGRNGRVRKKHDGDWMLMKATAFGYVRPNSRIISFHIMCSNQSAQFSSQTPPSSRNK